MKHIYKLLFVTAILLFVGTGYSQTWHRWTTANTGMTSDTMFYVCVDPNGNIYVCNAGSYNEFGRLNGNLDTSWKDLRDSIRGGYPEDVYYYEGNLWVYSYNGPGCTKFDGSTWAEFTNPVDNYVSFFSSDNKGQLWTCGEGVDVRRTSGQWNHFSNTQSFTHFPDNSPSVVAFDSSGNAYVAFTYDAGVVKLDPTSGHGTYLTPDSTQFANLSNRPVRSLAVDWSGNIWCATLPNGSVGGVYKINADGSGGYMWSTDSSISWISNDVRTVAVDHCGKVWIGTDGGASVYDGSNWTIENTFNTPNILSDSINFIDVDQWGHLWFCTDQGLAEYMPPVSDKTFLNTPANSSTITTDTITCKWAWDCPNITGQRFEIADNPNFTNSTIDTVNITYLSSGPAHFLSGLKDKTTYYWRVKQENDQGYGPSSDVWSFSVNKETGVSEERGATVNGFDLQQNYPNPFSDETTIKFSMPQRENVSLKVYDMLGREVATLALGEFERGAYSVPFDASSISALHNGLYVYRLQAGDVHIEHTMQVLR